MKNLVILLSVITILTVASCTEKQTNSKEPVACFTVSKDSFDVTETITANASCSKDAASYLWNFGDGQTATTSTATHQYSTPGAYTISLQVVNADGSDTASKVVSVTTTAITSADYVGTFDYTESCINNGTTTGTAVVTSPSAGKIVITLTSSGGSSMTMTINADVIGDGTSIAVPPQNNAAGDDFVGSGLLSSDKITITIPIQYTNGAASVDNCTTTLVRK